MPAKRVVLESITARLLWDGRPEDGRFIPGLAHFDAGVRALRGAEKDAGPAWHLGEIDRALREAEEAVNLWARGLRAFARELGYPDDGAPGWEDGERRGLRVRTAEAARLADLIGAFDAACSATAAVTAAARRGGVFNPHHESIRERARLIRRIVDLGHAGGRAWRRTRGAAGGTKAVRAGGRLAGG